MGGESPAGPWPPAPPSSHPAHTQTHGTCALRVFCCVSALHLQRAAGLALRLRRAQGCPTSSCAAEPIPAWQTPHHSCSRYLCCTLWFLLTSREPCKSLDLYQLPAAHSLPEFKDLLWKHDNAQTASSAAPGNPFLALTIQQPVSSSDSPLFLQQSLGT